MDELNIAGDFRPIGTRGPKSREGEYPMGACRPALGGRAGWFWPNAAAGACAVNSPLAALGCYSQ